MGAELPQPGGAGYGDAKLGLRSLLALGASSPPDASVRLGAWGVGAGVMGGVTRAASSRRAFQACSHQDGPLPAPPEDPRVVMSRLFHR